METNCPGGPVERLVGRLRVAATKLGRSDEWEDLRDDLHHAAAEIERLQKRCSPSRVVMIGDVGHYVSEGVAEGIESLRQAVKPFAEFDLLEHRIPPEFAMLVLRARGALERVVVTPNVELSGRTRSAWTQG